MAGKFPGKPVAAKPPRARKAPVSAVPGVIDSPAPVLEALPGADSAVSTVALAVADLPAGTDALSATSATAAEAATPAKPVTARTSAAPAAQPPETLAEAPAAPMPERQSDAMPAPAADQPASFAAAEPKTVEPDAAPAAAAQKEAVMETATSTVETTATKAEAMFADMNSRTKVAIEKSQKLAEEMGEFHKGNLEAAVESAKIYAKGVEAMGQEAAEFGRRSFEQMTAALKSMAQVKTPAELMKLHADYVRQSFDAAVAEGSKTTEAVIKLAGDVAQPMSSRFALAAEKVKAVA